MFRVKNRTLSYSTRAVSQCPIFGYLNIVLLSILDNIDITVLRVQIKKLQIQLKNDRMSLLFEKVNGKIQKGRIKSLGHRIAVLAKDFNEL